jgi:hypothetical protein
MTGSWRRNDFRITDRGALKPLGRRSKRVGRRLAVLGAFALVVLCVSAGSASAVIVEGPGGQRFSYTPLAGAPRAPLPGSAPSPVRSKAWLSPECFGTNACNQSESEPLTWHDGAAMPSTTTYFVYWDPKGAPAFPPGYASGIKTYFKGLQKENGSDQNMYSVLTQYYGYLKNLGTPGPHVKAETHFGKAVNDKQAYPAEPAICERRLTTPCIGYEQIEAELLRLVNAHKLPAEFKAGGYLAGELPQVAYFVLLPPGVSTCLPGTGACSNLDFCAYHSNSNFEEVFNNPSSEGPEIYGVQPYVVGNKGCDSGQHPNGVSDGALDGGLVHEFAEMITDPEDGLGWLNHNPGEEEVGDICQSFFWAGGNTAFHEKMMYGTPLGTAPDGALYNQVVDGHDYYYQQEWSNEAEGCRQRRALPPTVTKLAPAKGKVAGGSKVKITGLNFQNPTVTSVKFGAVPATSFTVTSPTSLTAVSPPGIAGSVEVTVTNTAGTSASTPTDQFKYE